MIEGLGYGADDYLTKPFSLSVLRSRIQAHLRREQRRSWIRQDGWQDRIGSRTSLSADSGWH